MSELIDCVASVVPDISALLSNDLRWDGKICSSERNRMVGVMRGPSLLSSGVWSNKTGQMKINAARDKGFS